MALSSQTRDSYRATHWGLDGDTEYYFHEPDLPADLQLPEMGKLGEIGVGRGNAEGMIQFGDGAVLAYDVTTDRLYSFMQKADREVFRHQLWRDEDTWALYELAGQVGGEQNRHPYAKVRVCPLGPVSYVVYYTHKHTGPDGRYDQGQPDAPAYYEHKLGEVSGLRPWLGVDKSGRLWWAGGNYEVRPEGIVD